MKGRAGRSKKAVTAKPSRISETGKIDVMGLYLDDAARFNLLSAEEEFALGEIIQAGLEAQETLESGPPSDPKKKRDLQRKVREGQRAEHDFVVANLRLVISIAKKYVRGGRHDLKEVVQYGNFGLLHAVRKFDPQKGFKFSTYATWWVKQAIARGLSGEDVIYMPSRVLEERNLLLHVKDELSVTYFRRPTCKELSEVTGIPEDRVEEVLSFDTQPVSLATPLSSSGEGEETISDLVPCPKDNFHETEFRQSAEIVIAKVFQYLNAQEKRVITALYGLDGSDPRTMAQVGVEENLTKDQVRLMVGRISTRIKHPSTGIVELAGDALKK